MKRIVLAYSGGFGSSLAIPRLAREFGAEIIAVTIDFGQAGELADDRERALALGALRAHVIDARDELIRDFILPSLQAGALLDGRYPFTAALSRALLARKLVDIARMEGSSAIAYGRTGADDRTMIDMVARAWNGSFEVIAAPRAPHPGELDFVRALGIPWPSSGEPFHADVNLWGRTISPGRDVRLPERLPEDIFALTRGLRDSPDEPAWVHIEFDSGIPLRVNGVDMPLLDLIESLQTIAGSHGVGRLHRLAGADDGGSCEIQEAPAAVVLHAAHGALEASAVSPDLARRKREVSRAYAGLMAAGRWFDPARDRLDRFVAELQPHVTGAVLLRLFKGDCVVARCQSSTAPETTPAFAGRQADR